MQGKPHPQFYRGVYRAMCNAAVRMQSCGPRTSTASCCMRQFWLQHAASSESKATSLELRSKPARDWLARRPDTQSTNRTAAVHKEHANSGGGG